jgi:hypothetical protein
MLVNRKKDMSRIQAAGIRFLRTVKGCDRQDKLRNKDT